MTDQERESQLSAMFDGELPNAECELLARRLARDPQMQRSWATYSLIGTVLRSEPLAQRSFAGEVSRRVARDERAAARDSLIDDTRSRKALAGGGSGTSTWWVPFSGVGVAAGVAALAIFFGRIPSEQELAETRMAQLGTAEVVLAAAVPVNTDTTRIAAAGTATAPASSESAPSEPQISEPESYVTPLLGEGREGAGAGRVASLANYVVAHSSVSAPLLRHSTLAAFVTAEVPEPVVPNDLEQTRAPDSAAAGAAAGAERR